MVFVPTTSLILGPRIALVASALINLLVGLGMLLAMRYENEDWRFIWGISGFMVLGTLVGSTLAGYVPAQIVLGLIGLFVLFFGANFILYDLPLPPKSFKSRFFKPWAGGVIGGFTGGLVGISGPFVVAVTRPLMGKTRFRRVMVAILFIGGALRLFVYGAVGMWNVEVVKLIVLASPGVIIGLFIGFRTHVTIGERKFNLVVGILLVLIALRIGWGLMG
jgi:uncharacterized membrane protein YfcA